MADTTHHEAIHCAEVGYSAGLLRMDVLVDASTTTQFWRGRSVAKLVAPRLALISVDLSHYHGFSHGYRMVVTSSLNILISL